MVHTGGLNKKMKDITNKIETLRIAKATAIVRMNPGSIKAIKDNSSPKKDALATARAAALLAVKNTCHVIPHCHPLPVESVEVLFNLSRNSILLEVEVKTCYKTGCEMEALYGASVAALTIYDMIKPTDKNIRIEELKLESKSGGKSDYTEIPKKLKSAIIVISDSVSKNKGNDRSGLIIKEKLESFEIFPDKYKIIPDEPGEIKSLVLKFCKQGFDLIITTGGTGLSSRDNTPETIIPLLEKQIDGIMEAARNYGQRKTPFSMLSRGIAGTIGNSLILTLPGSTRGVIETMDALFPYVFHLFKVIGKHYRHEMKQN